MRACVCVRCMERNSVHVANYIGLLMATFYLCIHHGVYCINNCSPLTAPLPNSYYTLRPIYLTNYKTSLQDMTFTLSSSDHSRGKSHRHRHRHLPIDHCHCHCSIHHRSHPSLRGDESS